MDLGRHAHLLQLPVTVRYKAEKYEAYPSKKGWLSLLSPPLTAALVIHWQILVDGKDARQLKPEDWGRRVTGDNQSIEIFIFMQHNPTQMK